MNEPSADFVEVSSEVLACTRWLWENAVIESLEAEGTQVPVSCAKSLIFKLGKLEGLLLAEHGHMQAMWVRQIYDEVSTPVEKIMRGQLLTAEDRDRLHAGWVRIKQLRHRFYLKS